MQLLLGNRDLLKCIYNTSRNEISLGALRRFIVMSAPHCANDQLQKLTLGATGVELRCKGMVWGTCLGQGMLLWQPDR